MNALAPDLPALVSVEALAEMLEQPNLIIVCTGSEDTWRTRHIPGALHLNPKRLNAGEPPITGLLPPMEELERLFQKIGLTRGTRIVGYDDEATTSAARLFWVLEAMGHKAVAFLDGGLAAWLAAGLPVESVPRTGDASDWRAIPDPSVIVNRHQILEHLQAADFASGRVKLLDTRSADEHRGEKSASERKGRIPGSVNLDWLETISEDRTLKPREVLLEKLAAVGITPADDVIVHCQTHQRSSHSFMMLRSLGFENVRGYPGSWSDWAADAEMPIDSGPVTKTPSASAK